MAPPSSRGDSGGSARVAQELGVEDTEGAVFVGVAAFPLGVTLGVVAMTRPFTSGVPSPSAWPRVRPARSSSRPASQRLIDDAQSLTKEFITAESLIHKQL